MEQKIQRESAVSLALALRRQFTIHGDVLERFEVFKYLGHLLAQDGDNAQVIRQQLRKARSVWARVGQVLRGENVGPRIATKFYKAVVQAVLLYGSETWNLTKLALAQLEGFHVRAAYKMARKYIQVCRQTIATCVATRPILTACIVGKRRRGSMPHQWWWEQPMCLDAEDAIGSKASDGHLVASTAADA